MLLLLLTGRFPITVGAVTLGVTVQTSGGRQVLVPRIQTSGRS